MCVKIQGGFNLDQYKQPVVSRVEVYF